MPLRMNHPQLIADAGEIETLRVRLQNDAALKKEYDRLVAGREEQLQVVFLTEEYANSVYTQHGLFYEVGAQLEKLCRVLCPSALVENDGAAKDKLKAALAHFTAFSAWTGPQNKDKEIPWQSDLSTTRIAVEAAFAFDTVYNELTAKERETYAARILHLGVLPLLADWVLPQTRIHALDSMGHNWWSVCISLAGVALLPLFNELPAQTYSDYFEQIEDALCAFLTYPGCTLFNKVPNYDEKGLFYESVGYFNYGTGELLRYLWHSERYFGRRESLRNALPRGMDTALLAFSYPVTEDGKTAFRFLNFGDSDYRTSIAGVVTYLRLLGYDTPALAQYAAANPPAPCLLSLTAMADLPKSGSLDGLSKTALFPATGYAICRSSFAPDSTLLAVKSGYTWNHAHSDAGSFTLYAGGEPLVIDSGTCSYGDPAYISYYCADLSHNVLRIGDEGQRREDIFRGSKFPGSICDSYVNEDLFLVQADATGPMAHLCTRMYRNFLWLSDKYLLILDDVYTNEPKTVQFLLHTATPMKAGKDENGHPVWKAETEKGNGVRVYPLAAEAETVRVSEGHPAQKPKEVLPYLTFSTLPNEKRAHLLAHLVAVTKGAETDAEVESGWDGGQFFLRLRDKDTGRIRTVRYNPTADGRRMHINSNATVGGFDTDAYILMTDVGKNQPTRVFFVNASYLRRGETVFFRDFAKKTGAVELP